MNFKSIEIFGDSHGFDNSVFLPRVFVDPDLTGKHAPATALLAPLASSGAKSSKTNRFVGDASISNTPIASMAWDLSREGTYMAKRYNVRIC
jgi:hypothetical protein